MFVKNIQPKWEDPQNAGGRILQLAYEIKDELNDFLDYTEEYLLKLILYVIGESLPCAKHVSLNVK